MNLTSKGWRMPAEWEPHDRCWMAWPTRRRWGNSFERVCQTLARIASAIARFEPVTVVAQPSQIDEAARICGARVNVLGMPLDDLWIRDTGPTFLLSPHAGLAGATWRFNAWGGKHRSYAREAPLALMDRARC